ncbi:MAG TPA: polysaccharide deacetylase family protein [Candidatus Acidoferrum sp.]|nr:polysaccharide deacetylase family protein [Candidatus Acidoferrum sp.]
MTNFRLESKMSAGVPLRTRLRIEKSAQLPRAALIYGIRELARRAGVSSEQFRTWRIDFEDPTAVTVFVKPGTSSRLRFASASQRFWNNLGSGAFHTSTAGWMRDPEWSPVRDFKIPFSSDHRSEIGPLFRACGVDCIECPVDLLSSTVLTLARFEETLPVPRDAHGRFPARSSIAWKDQFLYRPIVDEYGLALEQALSYLLPGWTAPVRRLRLKLGHDVDDIGIPFSVRAAVGHTLRRKRPLASFRDLLAAGIGVETTYQKLLRTIVELSLERDLDSAVYWKASSQGPHDSGYDPNHDRVKNMIADFRSQGIEMGIHPGYDTADSVEILAAEVSALRKLLGENRLGGRQDFLRWTPQMWIQWDSLGLSYDASVGFADHIGFRAGTAYPFCPWLLSENREAKLLEIPLLAMDSTLFAYMKLGPEEALTQLQEYAARCRTVGGVFTLVWHNTTLMNRHYLRVYKRFLRELAGTDRYDWRAALDEIV